MKRGNDIDITKQIAPYRRIMPYIMPGRNEAAIYYQFTLDLTHALPLLEKLNQQSELRYTVFQLFLRAATFIITQNPRLNRYVLGKRFFQRKKIFFSFAAKKAFNENAPLVVIKMEFSPDETLAQMVTRLQNRLAEHRSTTKSYTDRELKLVLMLPRFLIRFLLKLLSFADYYNILPESFRRNDPMYGTAFFANLGSLGLDTCWHHLYEYGDISFFIVLGKIKDHMTIKNNKPHIYKGITIKVTFDERIEDGFYVSQVLDLVHHYFRSPEILIDPLKLPTP